VAAHNIKRKKTFLQEIIESCFFFYFMRNCGFTVYTVLYSTKRIKMVTTMTNIMKILWKCHLVNLGTRLR